MYAICRLKRKILNALVIPVKLIFILNPLIYYIACKWSVERGRVVRRSRRAHNPEIDGSNPSPATASKSQTQISKSQNGNTNTK
jgi:hypothetical protein